MKGKADSNLSPYRQRLNREAAILAAAFDQFNILFPTEAECNDAVYDILLANNFVWCRVCSSRVLERLQGSRIARCCKCSHTFSITAQTYFHGMKDLRPGLAQIFFAEQGIIPSCPNFARLFGIATATAWELRRRMLSVVTDMLRADDIGIPSICFAQIISKRSRETPAREHPQAEIDAARLASLANMHQGVDDGFEQSVGDGNPMEGMNARSFDVIDISLDSAGSGVDGYGDDTSLVARLNSILSDLPQHIDSLSVYLAVPVKDLYLPLIQLELAGAIQCVGGNQYAIKRSMEDKKVGVESNIEIVFDAVTRQSVSNVIGFISDQFKGISRRYLQYYLAGFSFCFNRERWPIGTLLRSCIAFWKGHDFACNYVSPYVVFLARS